MLEMERVSRRRSAISIGELRHIVDVSVDVRCEKIGYWWLRKDIGMSVKHG